LIISVDGPRIRRGRKAGMLNTSVKA